MQRVWIAVLSVWAMLAIVAVLAWTHQPSAATLPQATPQTLIVKGPNGKRQLLVVQPATTAAPHATTSTSAVAR
jgi:cyanate permease